MSSCCYVAKVNGSAYKSLTLITKTEHDYYSPNRDKRRLPAMLFAAVVLIEPKVQKECDAGLQKQQGYIRDDAVEICR